MVMDQPIWKWFIAEKTLQACIPEAGWWIFSCCCVFNFILYIDVVFSVIFASKENLYSSSWLLFDSPFQVCRFPLNAEPYFGPVLNLEKNQTHFGPKARRGSDFIFISVLHDLAEKTGIIGLPKDKFLDFVEERSWFSIQISAYSWKSRKWSRETSLHFWRKQLL